jgi:hypothetical protein
LKQPYQYGGGFTDEATGLIKTGIRYYDPVLERFSQRPRLSAKCFQAFKNVKWKGRETSFKFSFHPLRQCKMESGGATTPTIIAGSPAFPDGKLDAIVHGARKHRQIFPGQVLMIQWPIVAIEQSDVYILRNVQDFSSRIETQDVSNDEYSFYDANGRELSVLVNPDGMLWISEKVGLEKGEAVIAVLTTYLEYAQGPLTREVRSSLPALIELFLALEEGHRKM